MNKNSTTDEEGNTQEYTEEQKAEIEQNVKDFRKAAKDDFNAVLYHLIQDPRIYRMLCLQE